MSRRDDGRFWEEAAADFLRRRGLRILESGYRCRFGELDLVCEDDTTLVVVEVRSRGDRSAVRAAESIDEPKRRKLILATRHLLMCRPAWSQHAVRFDVVAIDGAGGPRPRCEWLRGAFELD